MSDPALLRPADVPETRGDPSKAQRVLGWSPTRSFDDLVEWMVRADVRRLETGLRARPCLPRVKLIQVTHRTGPLPDLGCGALGRPAHRSLPGWGERDQRPWAGSAA